MTINIKNPTPTKNTVLFVDCERKSQDRFKQLLSPEFKVETVFNSTQALSALSGRLNTFGVLVVGNTAKYDNEEKLVTYSQANYPNLVRILTLDIDREASINITNFNQFSQFIPRPWDQKQLVQNIRDSIVMSLNIQSANIPKFIQTLSIDNACKEWLSYATYTGESLSNRHSGIDALVTLYEHKITCPEDADISKFISEKIHATTDNFEDLSGLSHFEEYPKGVLH